MSYTYRYGFCPLLQGVPDWKFAGQLNNTTGLLISSLSIPRPQPADPDAPAPDTSPAFISPRIMSTTPQCNFILITQRALEPRQSTPGLAWWDCCFAACAFSSSMRGLKLVSVKWRYLVPPTCH